MDFEEFRSIENSTEIEKIQWLGVPAWDFLRFRIAQGKGRSSNEFRYVRRNTFRGILKFIFVICGQNREKHLFLGTNVSRYLERNGFKDPWCDPIIDLLGQGNCVKFYEGAYDKRVSGWPAEFLKSIATGLRRFGPKMSAKRTAKQIKELCDKHEVPAPSVSAMAALFLDRWAVWTIYRYLLRVLQPRSMFVICSYGKEPQIIAAKSLGIPVLELQHGVISERHFGYSFPYVYKKQAFPDFLLTYGPYWRRHVSPPIANSRMIDIGFAWREMENVLSVPEKNVVLFVSQWTLSKQIFDYAREFAAIASMQGIKVVVRLHPREKITGEMIEKLQSAGVLIQEPQNIPPYAAIGNASIVVGVSSTMIFEALSMGRSAYIIRDLIDAGYISDIPRVDTPEHLLRMTQVKSTAAGDSMTSLAANFFSSFDPSRIVEILESANHLRS
jgi:hypothetical protein